MFCIIVFTEYLARAVQKKYTIAAPNQVVCKKRLIDVRQDSCQYITVEKPHSRRVRNSLWGDIIERNLTSTSEPESGAKKDYCDTCSSLCRLVKELSLPRKHR
jgi:hypothetical protein